jgi:hypothetical protein
MVVACLRCPVLVLVMISNISCSRRPASNTDMVAGKQGITVTSSPPCPARIVHMHCTALHCTATVRRGSMNERGTRMKGLPAIVAYMIFNRSWGQSIFEVMKEGGQHVL